MPDPWDPEYDEAIGGDVAYVPDASELVRRCTDDECGVRLLNDLQQIDPADLTADELVTLVQQTQRLVAFVNGFHLQALAAAHRGLTTHWTELQSRAAERQRLADEAAGSPGGTVVRRGSSFVPPELAARNELAPALRQAPQTADVEIELACSLDGPWRPLRDALLAGTVTLPHVRAIGRALQALPAFGEPDAEDLYEEQCAEIIAAVLPYATRSTPGEMRTRTEGLVLATDPAAARERRRKAAEDEHGVFLTPLDSGSCELKSILPLAHGVAVMSAVNTLARDDRFETAAGCITAGQRRVAALVALALGEPGTVSEVTGPVHEAKLNPQVNIVVPLASLTSTDEDSAQGGTIDGHPVGADVIREILAESGPTTAMRRLVTDPAGCVMDVGRGHYSPTKLQKILARLRDGRCRFPGCRAPAYRCEIDHALSWRAGGRTDLDNLGLLCKRHHQAKTHGGWEITASFRDGRCRWRSPLGRVYDHEPPALLPPPPTLVRASAPPEDDPPPF